MQALTSPDGRTFIYSQNEDEKTIQFQRGTMGKYSILVILIGIAVIASQYNWFLIKFGNAEGISVYGSYIIGTGLGAIILGVVLLVGSVNFHFSNTSIAKSISVCGKDIYKSEIPCSDLINYEIENKGLRIVIHHEPQSDEEDDDNPIIVIDSFASVQEMLWLWEFIKKEAPQLAELPIRENEQ